MELQSCFLCDSATIREGLLHVLGGGITRVWRPALPAPLGVAFVCLIALEPDECGQLHEVHLLIEGPDHPLGDAMGAIEAKLPAQVEPEEKVLMPLVLPLHGFGTDSYGRHVFSLSVDGEKRGKIQCWVLHPDERALPSPL